jgi:splicing factor 45
MDTKISSGQFAPPQYNFEPPSNLNENNTAPNGMTGDDAYARRDRQNDEVEMPDVDYKPPPPAPAPDGASSNDAYARRLQVSQPQFGESIDSQPPPPPPPPQQQSSVPSMSAFQPASATISRAPVRYTLPPAPKDIPATEEELEEVFATEQPVDEGEEKQDAPRSLRPGQKGFAERLMAKYGWTKGTGLGASGSGMVKALQVKVEKQKKRPDAQGGGFVTPAGRGRIIASGKKSADEGKFGPMSEVIILLGMVDGMDLDAELNSGQDGGLMQEIGEECNEKVSMHHPPNPSFY